MTQEKMEAVKITRRGRRKLPRHICEGCRFWRPLSDSKGGMKACHYLLDTGEVRGCSPQGCLRYQSKEEGAYLLERVSRILNGDSKGGTAVDKR